MTESNEVGIASVGDNYENKKVKKSLGSKNPNETTCYLTPNARQAFTQLRQTFTKALIFWHFDLEYHIRIEINTFGYAISEVLHQLILDNLGKWQPVAYYS